MDRVLQGTTATIELTISDADGQPTAADGPVTVVVYDGAGTEIQEATTADLDEGVYSAEVAPSATAKLDELRAVWTATIDDHEQTFTTYVLVVGDRLLSVAGLKATSELSQVSGPELRALANEVEDEITEILGFPPVPEGLRFVGLQAQPGPRLLLPGVLYLREIYSMSVGGKVVDVEDVVLGSGWLEVSSGAAGRADIHVAHGWKTPPSDLRAAARILAIYRHRQPKDKTPERALRVITQGSDITLSQPGEDEPTGLPQVDRVLKRYRIGSPMPV